MGLYCVQLAHFSIGDWKDISIAHVIINIESEVSTFPIVFIFFRGCVPEMFVTSYSVTYCMNVPGKLGICFHYYGAVYDECKYSDAFWLADRIYMYIFLFSFAYQHSKRNKLSWGSRLHRSIPNLDIMDKWCQERPWVIYENEISMRRVPMSLCMVAHYKDGA